MINLAALDGSCGSDFTWRASAKICGITGWSTSAEWFLHVNYTFLHFVEHNHLPMPLPCVGNMFGFKFHKNATSKFKVAH